MTHIAPENGYITIAGELKNAILNLYINGYLQGTGRYSNVASPYFIILPVKKDDTFRLEAASPCGSYFNDLFYLPARY